MAKRKQELFHKFGRLDTWIVGLQYYAGASAAEDQDVIFECDPENPFDSNAVAVFTTKGVKLGNLPRYDAEYFSPLISTGLVALKGHAGVSNYGDRIPLSLEIFATAKVSEVLEKDNSNNWRAIYHNIFVNIWMGLNEYSAETLEEFRNRFRPIAHDEPLFPKTQFLYRMLKAHIAELRQKETDKLRDKVLKSYQKIKFGAVMGWPELTVIPLYPTAKKPGKKKIAAKIDKSENRALISREGETAIEKQLPLRCPYPEGACGLAVIAYGHLHSFDWFGSPEITQVYWFERIVRANFDATPVEVKEKCDTPKTLKAYIKKMLKSSEYKLRDDEEEDDGLSGIIIRNGIKFAGEALYKDEKLASMTFSLDHIYVMEEESYRDEDQDQGIYHTIAAKSI